MRIILKQVRCEDGKWIELAENNIQFCDVGNERFDSSNSRKSFD
jgi:hypothetical protein